MALAVDFAGDIIGETLAVFHSGDAAGAVEGGVHVLDYLACAAHDEHLFVAEHLVCDAVAAPVNADDLSVFGDGVCAAEIDVRVRSLFKGLVAGGAFCTPGGSF